MEGSLLVVQAHIDICCETVRLLVRVETVSNLLNVAVDNRLDEILVSLCASLPPLVPADYVVCGSTGVDLVDLVLLDSVELLVVLEVPLLLIHVLISLDFRFDGRFLVHKL